MTTTGSSFSNPCELVRSTCRQWMDDTGGLVLQQHPRPNDEQDDESNDDNNNNSSSDVDISSLSLPLPLVRLQRDKLPALAKEILQSVKEKEKQQQRQPPTSNSSFSWIEWDSEGWHYSGTGFHGTVQQKRERIALFLLALDAINFCFWPYPDHDGSDVGTLDNGPDEKEQEPQQLQQPRNNPMEYEHLTLALKGLAEADHNNSGGDNDDVDDYNRDYAFAPHNMAQMTAPKMKELLKPYLDETKYPIPNIQKRAELWREVGVVLLRDFNGSVFELLNRATMDASTVVELVASSFPGFRDEVMVPLDGQRGQQQQSTPSSSLSSLPALLLSPKEEQPLRRVVFLKRAQIFVGDINAALDLQLTGLDRLTTFADYRVPQILRHWEILQYSPTLAGIVDSEMEIPSGSVEEISIRAGTVVAVEELVKFLNGSTEGTESENTIFTTTTTTKDGGDGSSKNNSFTDVNVDWYLWQVGERMHQESLMKPFHKVKTHFY